MTDEQQAAFDRHTDEGFRCTDPGCMFPAQQEDDPATEEYEMPTESCCGPHDTVRQYEGCTCPCHAHNWARLPET